MMHGLMTLFFFSSRRRHTRWPRDWSSDVCSSDLAKFVIINNGVLNIINNPKKRDLQKTKSFLESKQQIAAEELFLYSSRSEERRVGKECRVQCTRKQ